MKENLGYMFRHQYRRIQCALCHVPYTVLPAPCSRGDPARHVLQLCNDHSDGPRSLGASPCCVVGAHSSSPVSMVCNNKYNTQCRPCPCLPCSLLELQDKISTISTPMGNRKWNVVVHLTHNTKSWNSLAQCILLLPLTTSFKIHNTDSYIISFKYNQPMQCQFNAI